MLVGAVVSCHSMRAPGPLWVSVISPPGAHSPWGLPVRSSYMETDVAVLEVITSFPVQLSGAKTKPPTCPEAGSLRFAIQLVITPFGWLIGPVQEPAYQGGGGEAGLLGGRVR